MIIQQSGFFPESIIERSKVPIFALPEYAQYFTHIKSYNIIWLIGINETKAEFIIPFGINKKYFIRKGIFLTAPICTNESSTAKNEKTILNELVNYINKHKLCDWIVQPPNWAIFETYPDKSIYCLFGTYKIDLHSAVNIDELFVRISKDDRKDIKKAIREGVEIKIGLDCLDDAVKVISETANSANIFSPSKEILLKESFYLKQNFFIYVAYYKNQPQASVVFYSTKYCVYGIYGGSISHPFRGANSYLFWQSIQDAKIQGIKYFDFVGARINPLKESKQYRIQQFKEHFGGEFQKGYLWKYIFSPLKYKLYTLAVRIAFLMKNKPYKEDIIDQEIRRNEQ